MNTPNASFQLLLGSDWCDIFQVEILFASNNLILDLGSGEQLRVPFVRSNRRHNFHFTETQEAIDESSIITDPYALYRLEDGSICYDAIAADDAASYTSSQYSRMTDDATGNAENGAAGADGAGLFGLQHVADHERYRAGVRQRPPAWPQKRTAPQAQILKRAEYSDFT